MAETYDAIVLGVGGFGSATLLHLARRGLNVLGIEQFGIGHDRGSSHGESRIIRKAYFEHPDYVPLLHVTYQHWADLEAESGVRLVKPTGLFLAGPADGEAIAGSRQAARMHSLPLEDVSLDEARQRFPQFRFRDDQEVVFEKEAGLLNVEQCVLTHVLQARTAGASVAVESVRSWSADAMSVHVKTNVNEYRASRLIVTAGAWTRQVLADLHVDLTVLRKPQFWHRVETPVWRDVPAFFFETPTGCFYGFPSRDGESIKVAEHTGGDVVSEPTGLDRSLLPGEATSVEAFVKRTTTGVVPVADRYSICMYTMSPDGHFFVDRHPQFPHVVLGAGFSGHGFKFTPVIGQALADLAVDGSTSLPIDFLQLDRPGLASR